MATEGEEVAAPETKEVEPYNTPVKSLADVEVGDLVVVRSPDGTNKIQKVRGKEKDYKGRGPAVDVGTFWVSLKPGPKDFMGAFKLFRRPAAPAAAPATAPAGDGGEEETEGGKRRRGKSRRGKSRRSVRKSRKSTRRRRA